MQLFDALFKTGLKLNSSPVLNVPDGADLVISSGRGWIKGLEMLVG